MSVPISLTLLKIAGGANLVWRAGRTALPAWRGDTATGDADEARTASLWWDCRGGFLVVLMNSKAALM